MILSAKQRGDLSRTIILAHQIEAMARQKRLKPVEEYLKPFEKQRRRRKLNQNALVAAHLDRIAARKETKGTEHGG